MKKVIYPGTFDPPTFGHLDIIKKATIMFDRVVVGVGSNSRKNETSFRNRDFRL
jgi:pantetheine-phosphate adenylyltransferase